MVEVEGEAVVVVVVEVVVEVGVGVEVGVDVGVEVGVVVGNNNRITKKYCRGNIMKTFKDLEHHPHPVSGVITMDTQDHVRDAEVHTMVMDIFHEKQANDYAERVTASMHDLETFQQFLCDIDPDAAEVQAFHGCLDDSSDEIKAFAYDTFMNLFEEYVHSVTEV